MQAGRGGKTGIGQFRKTDKTEACHCWWKRDVINRRSLCKSDVLQFATGRIDMGDTWAFVGNERSDLCVPDIE